MEDKKTKKKTKKNKEWVKNIDTTAEEKRHIKNLQKKINDNAFEKIENYIIYDVDKQELPKGFIKKDNSLDTKNTKPLGKNLEKMIERKRRNLELEIEKKGLENKNVISAKGISTSNINLDLWNDNCNSNSNSYFNDKSTTIKFPNTTNISVPKIALPHPGNSYNPRVQDSKNLIDSITSNNSHLLELAKYKDHLKNLRNSKLDQLSDSDSDSNSDDDSESENECDSKENNKSAEAKKITAVQNNKMTKTERNKLRQRKINRMKNEEKLKKKLVKVEISNIKSFKRFEKEKKKLEIAELEEQKKKEDLKSKRDKLLSAGAFIDSNEIKLLNDSSLRKVAKNDYVRDKFTNILNQGLIGGYNYLTSKDDRQNKK